VAKRSFRPELPVKRGSACLVTIDRKCGFGEGSEKSTGHYLEFAHLSASVQIALLSHLAQGTGEHLVAIWNAESLITSKP
jgi:hypothetical protein